MWLSKEQRVRKRTSWLQRMENAGKQKNAAETGSVPVPAQMAREAKVPERKRRPVSLNGLPQKRSASNGKTSGNCKKSWTAKDECTSSANGSSCEQRSCRGGQEVLTNNFREMEDAMGNATAEIASHYHRLATSFDEAEGALNEGLGCMHKFIAKTAAATSAMSVDRGDTGARNETKYRQDALTLVNNMLKEQVRRRLRNSCLWKWGHNSTEEVGFDEGERFLRFLSQMYTVVSLFMCALMLDPELRLNGLSSHPTGACATSVFIFSLFGGAGSKVPGSCEKGATARSRSKRRSCACAATTAVTSR